MDRPTHWNILIIDDNPDDCADFRQMLIAGSGRTCHFTHAHLGEAGTQMILDNQSQSLEGNVSRFDCVLLDFNLPDQNATQFLAKLCDPFGMPPHPVVVITGWDGVQADEGMRLLQAGAQDYIGKSWTTPPSLCRAVENSIDRFNLQRTHAVARQALEKSEERYRTLFNAIDEGYCVIEMIFDAQNNPVDYRFLEINKAFETHTGLTDALGKTILQLIPEIEKSWLQAYGDVVLTGVPARLEDYVEHMNRWFDLYAFRFGDPANKQLGILFNNVTERKLIEGRLNEAVAAANSANRAKSEFLSNMSHELRTPLNAILGFAQLMQVATPPPTAWQEQSLSHIIVAGWYLLQLVNDTLDLASIEAGRLSVSPVKVSLDQVLQECTAIIGPLASKRNLSVSYPRQDTKNMTYADPIRLKQVLLNLLSNSVKYNRDGGCINVRYSRVNGQRLRISVQDTGLGMTPHQLEHLFEVFNRLGQEHSGIVGTGIGLVMSRRLVELMDGQLGVDSALGKGSDFWIELPLATSEADDLLSEPDQVSKAVRVATEPLSAFVPDGALGHTLLHIDDNPGNLELVAQLLAQRPQHRLLSATHGTLGIEIARAHLPALILIDIDLPDINGIEVLKILQADPQTTHIPVVALSANAMPNEIEGGLQTGFCRYVTKPIRVHEFFNSLDEALLISRQQDPNSPETPLDNKDPT
jgi:signal transduction histidine kinase/PleD family two-component response regulator